MKAVWGSNLGGGRGGGGGGGRVNYIWCSTDVQLGKYMNVHIFSEFGI